MKNQTISTVTSAIMIVIGTILLGYFVNQVVTGINQEFFVLDEVGIPPGMSEEFIPTDLDFISEGEVSPETLADIEEIKSYIVEAYAEEEEAELFYSRLPVHISIPSIGLDSPIYHAKINKVTIGEKEYQQWVAPPNGVGWHYQSAPLGVKGNTVFNGHHNTAGEVFKDLHTVKEGALIILQSPTKEYTYRVDSLMILPERYEKLEVRLQNARWIQPFDDDRITLVTCWPHTSNTHRVIVVAYPVPPTSEAP
jgi:LPXTG-site transpeptidase (sortase) family protein